jgi:uncharacterized protein
MEIMEQIIQILAFIVRSFIHIWPYLLITIPLAVMVNLSGASRYISKAFNAKPVVSILLATLVGAISPFCSCGVIPVITSLLIGGVPLGPVMSFWLASPSMDPEIFMLSAATVGWKLSVWRLVATFVISLSAGMITHIAQKKGYLGTSVLRKQLQSNTRIRIPVLARLRLAVLPAGQRKNQLVSCCTVQSISLETAEPEQSCSCSAACATEPLPLRKRILQESWKSFLMVAKFMAIAFLINALIKFYLPEDMIKGIIGTNREWSVLIATLIGIPFYTTNMTALPLVSGLLTLGMNPGAALAFLIAGPLTTLPAMMAVWGIVNRKVFFAYVAFGLVGSLFFGYLYNLL